MTVERPGTDCMAEIYRSDDAVITFDEAGKIWMQVGEGRLVHLSGIEACRIATKLRELIDYPID